MHAPSKCPICNKPTRVKRTRHEAGFILRERVCQVCGTKFTTSERQVGKAKLTDVAIALSEDPQSL